MQELIEKIKSLHSRITIPNIYEDSFSVYVGHCNREKVFKDGSVYRIKHWNGSEKIGLNENEVIDFFKTR